MLTALRTDRSSGRRRRIDRPLLLASLAIAAGLALIVWGLIVSVTGDDRDPLPDAIEEVSPAPGAEQVPQQSDLRIDLQSGFEGLLEIDGVEIPVVAQEDLGSTDVEPGEQLDVPPVAIYDRGNATISFTPNSQAPIDTLTSGRHDVRVTYWRTSEGRGDARSFTWQFEVV